MKNTILFYNENSDIEAYSILLDENTQKSIELLSVNGSSGVHLCMKSDDEIIRQVQISTHVDEIVKIKFENTADNFKSSNANRIELPPDNLYQVDQNAFCPIDSTQLDVLFIIDATIQSSSLGNIEIKDDDTGFLLDNTDFTEQLSEKLDSFLHAVNDQYSDIHYSILSFADVTTEGIRSRDLKPSYVLQPNKLAERFLHSWNEEKLKDDVKHLQTSSGCDYIDALAEALNAVADYNWRHNARKLIYIIGDSPGFSILNPPPVIGGMQANTAIRHFDIESEAMELHRNKIEIMSVYINDDEELERSIVPIDKLRLYTKKQYQGLASLKEYAHTWATWQPEKMASYFKQQAQQLIGRGFCYPVIK